MRIPPAPNIVSIPSPWNPTKQWHNPSPAAGSAGESTFSGTIVLGREPIVVSGTSQPYVYLDLISGSAEYSTTAPPSGLWPPYEYWLEVALTPGTPHLQALPKGIIVDWWPKTKSGTGIEIPYGWAICDGSDSRAPDLGGLFTVGYDPEDPLDEYTIIGNGGGYRVHGGGKNDHDPHVISFTIDHSHPFDYSGSTDGHRHTVQVDLDCTSKNVKAGNDDNVVTTVDFHPAPFNTSTTNDTFTISTSTGVWSSTLDDSLEHPGGPLDEGTTTDNRPPYIVVAKIMKL